jgi:hypothetical protein
MEKATTHAADDEVILILSAARGLARRLAWQGIGMGLEREEEQLLAAYADLAQRHCAGPEDELRWEELRRRAGLRPSDAALLMATWQERQWARDPEGSLARLQAALRDQLAEHDDGGTV